MPSPLPTPLEPFIHVREEVPRYWMVDSLWTVLASAEATGGALTVLDQLMPHRSGPPTHVHDRLHEYFYLLDGEIHFQLGQPVSCGSRTPTSNHPPPQSSTTPISPARPSSTPNAGYAPAKGPIFSPTSVTNFGPNSIQVLDSEPACHHQV